MLGRVAQSSKSLIFTGLWLIKTLKKRLTFLRFPNNDTEFFSLLMLFAGAVE